VTPACLMADHSSHPERKRILRIAAARTAWPDLITHWRSAAAILFARKVGSLRYQHKKPLVAIASVFLLLALFGKELHDFLALSSFGDCGQQLHIVLDILTTDKSLHGADSMKLGLSVCSIHHWGRFATLLE
jgi:hypothetical protein